MTSAKATHVEEVRTSITPCRINAVFTIRLWYLTTRQNVGTDGLEKLSLCKAEVGPKVNNGMVSLANLNCNSIHNPTNVGSDYELRQCVDSENEFGINVADTLKETVLKCHSTVRKIVPCMSPELLMCLPCDVFGAATNVFKSRIVVVYCTHGDTTEMFNRNSKVFVHGRAEGEASGAVRAGLGV